MYINNDFYVLCVSCMLIYISGLYECASKAAVAITIVTVINQFLNIVVLVLIPLQLKQKLSLNHAKNIVWQLIFYIFYFFSSPMYDIVS